MRALLPTLTHARIRAEQGDVDGARRILGEILALRPGDAEARALLRQIAASPARARRPSRDRSVVVLREWLERIRKRSGRARPR